MNTFAAVEFDMMSVRRSMAEASMGSCQLALDFMALGEARCHICGKKWKARPPNRLIVCRCSYEAIRLACVSQDPIVGAPNTLPNLPGTLPGLDGIVLDIDD